MIDINDGSLTPKEVAARWGVSEDVVYREINEGRLRHFKVGNWLKRVRPEWVEEYEQGRGAPTDITP